MKNFNQELWNQLDRNLKVSVACRYCVLPYFSNLVVQTGLSSKNVHLALELLTYIGVLKESWHKCCNGWGLCYRYDDKNTNDFIDQIISELEKA